MPRVKVTFFIEADDPDHSTGVTNDTFEQVNDAILNVGGEDIEFEKEDED